MAAAAAANAWSLTEEREGEKKREMLEFWHETVLGWAQSSTSSSGKSSCSKRREDSFLGHGKTTLFPPHPGLVAVSI